jgi:hypothetical protein
MYAPQRGRYGARLCDACFRLTLSDGLHGHRVAGKSHVSVHIRLDSARRARHTPSTLTFKIGCGNSDIRSAYRVTAITVVDTLLGLGIMAPLLCGIVRLGDG